MIEVVDCIVRDHDPRLVALAVIVALVGSAATIQLFGRILASRGRSRAGWLMLCSVGAGTMVWCTHFVAMMGFEAGVPVTLDPALTLASLGLAIVLAAPGLALAASRRRSFVLFGGAIVGAAVSAMHYTGMMAYRIDGFVQWRWPYVVASVTLSSVLSASAFALVRLRPKRGKLAGGVTLGGAVAALHFTGMTAVKVMAAALRPEQGLSDVAMNQLALGTAGAGLLFVGCASVSALIDSDTKTEAYRRLRRMAHYDGLTDLPNRLSFNEELEARRQRIKGAPHMAVIMLDLSRFKMVNDAFGHLAGDQLLVALAARLAEMLDPGEFVARLGGDEFAALFSHHQPSELSTFLARLRKLFDEPFVFEGFATTVDVNIGVAVAPQDGTDADTLLARADLAMYRAKKEHSPKPCFYDSAMDEMVRERRELASELRSAVATCAFELHYQVQASIKTGEISGYEALIRWNNATRGAISPATFIPLAEEIGEIIPLSNWVIAKACSEAAHWSAGYPVAINISAQHLSEPTLVDTVRVALQESGLRPNRLTIELTESAFIGDRRAAADRIRDLKDMGVKVALDDFGVGYSSLDVLRSIRFDKIKLDTSFVDDIEKDVAAIAILRSVVALGVALEIPVLAEGIEDVEQLCIIANEGISEIQGFLIGRPSRELVAAETVGLTLQGLKNVGRPVSLVA